MLPSRIVDKNNSINEIVLNKTAKIIIVLAVLFNIISYGQDSQSIGFHFKLFDESGNPVDYELFCTEYKFSLKGFTACTNKNMTKDYTYNDSTRYFTGSGVVIDGNLERKFIHKKDTMTLILATNYGQRKDYRIDSLYIKHGKYFVDEEKLKSIDFKKAEIGYYNWLLKNVLRIKKQIYNYQLKPQYLELNKLKRKYKIALDDYVEKKYLMQTIKLEK